MGADIKKLRNRIKSLKATLHLTKAMGLVASSKIYRATNAMNKSREYTMAIKNIINMLISCPECEKSPFMTERSTNRTRIIVIAGDRGLAGGYNANVFRVSKEYSDAEFIPIGKRTCDRFGGKKYSAEMFTYADAISLSKNLCENFISGKFDRLGIISTEYISVMAQEVQIKWILPLSKSDNKKKSSVIFEPDELTILNAAITEYVAGVIISSVRESFASEVAARKTAMNSAEKNAQQMIDELNLAYNRARQGTITQEITEIVAGSGS